MSRLLITSLNYIAFLMNQSGFTPSSGSMVTWFMAVSLRMLKILVRYLSVFETCSDVSFFCSIDDLVNKYQF